MTSPIPSSPWPRSAPKSLACLALLAWAMTTTPSALAQVIHKCVSATGQTIYSESPCGRSSRPAGMIEVPPGPSAEDRLEAERRLQRQQEYLRQREAEGRAEALERERLAIERRRVGQGDETLAQSRARDKWLRENVTRHTRSGWETRSREEWIEYDRATVRIERSGRRPIR